MKYWIIFDQPWRPGGREFGRSRLIHAGRYAVPEHITDALASRAIDEGAARREDVKAERTAKPKTQFAKGPAPENKALVGAKAER